MADVQQQIIESRLSDHLIEAGAMKAEIEHLKNSQADSSRFIVSALGELKGSIESLRSALSNVPQQISSCRAEMRREVEKDFPDRLYVLKMENNIEARVDAGDAKLSEQIRAVEKTLTEKMSAMSTASDKRQAETQAAVELRVGNLERSVDRLWIKITSAVTLVGLVLAGVAWIIDHWPMLSAVAGQ